MVSHLQLKVQTPPKTSCYLPSKPSNFNFLITTSAMIIICIPSIKNNLQILSPLLLHPVTVTLFPQVVSTLLLQSVPQILLIPPLCHYNHSWWPDHLTCRPLLSPPKHPHQESSFLNTLSTVQNMLIAQNGPCCHLTFIADYIYILAFHFNGRNQFTIIYIMSDLLSSYPGYYYTISTLPVYLLLETSLQVHFLNQLL